MQEYKALCAGQTTEFSDRLYEIYKQASRECLDAIEQDPISKQICIKMLDGEKDFIKRRLAAILNVFGDIRFEAVIEF